MVGHAAALVHDGADPVDTSLRLAQQPRGSDYIYAGTGSVVRCRTASSCSGRQRLWQWSLLRWCEPHVAMRIDSRTDPVAEHANALDFHLHDVTWV